MKNITKDTKELLTLVALMFLMLIIWGGIEFYYENASACAEAEKYKRDIVLETCQK